MITRLKQNQLIAKIFPLFSFVFLVISFSSCVNFLDGSELKNEIEQLVEYADAEQFIVRIIPESPKMGSVTTATEIKVKKTDSFEISFDVSDDFSFDHWEVLDKNTLLPVENVIDIENINRKSTTATVISTAKEIIIRPVCYEYLKVVSYTPNDTLGAVAKDRSIILTMNQEVDESNFFFTAEDFIEKGWFIKEDYGMGYEYIYPVNGFEPLYLQDSNDYYYLDYATTKYYGYRLNGETVYKGITIRCESEEDEVSRDYRPYYPNVEIQGNQIILKSNKNKIIPLYGNDTKVITVELDKNLTEKTSSIGMKEKFKMSYTISSDYQQPVKITYEEDLYVYKNGTRSPSNALYLNLRDDENFQYPYVGDTIKLELVLTDDSKYDFNYWDFDSRYINVTDPRSPNTTATVIEGVEEIKLTLVYKMKPISSHDYDHESPYVENENVHIYNLVKDSIGHVKDIEYLNLETPELYTEDTFTIEVSAHDYADSYNVRGSGIQYIKVEERLTKTRTGDAVALADQVVYTTYYDDSVFESKYIAIEPYYHPSYYGYISGYSDQVKLNTLYTIQTPKDQEGLITIKIFFIDYAGNITTNTQGDGAINFSFYRVSNILEDSAFVVTNEPEDWQQDEFTSWWSTLTRTTGAFNKDTYNEKICNLRWALRIVDTQVTTWINALNFDDNTIECYLKVNDGSETLVKCDSESEDTSFKYYNLNYHYLLDSDLFDNPNGIKLAFRIKDKTTGKEKTFYRFIPGPAVIKGITDKKFPLAPESYGYDKGPSRSVFVDQTIHPDNNQIFRTCSFVLDEQPLGSVDTENKYFTKGIENGVVTFKDHYGFTYENVLKVNKGNICAFNYYGNVFFSKNLNFYAYDSDCENYCYLPYYYKNIPQRLMGKAGTYWYDEDSSAVNTSVESSIDNTQALTISNFEFNTVDEVNTNKMTISISLKDSHVNDGDHEVINFISIYGYQNSDTKEKFLSTAYYDEATKKYVANLPSSLKSNNNDNFEISSFVLKPYRMVIKNNKSSTFEGEIYYTKDKTNNLSDVAGRGVLFENELIDAATTLPRDDYVIHYEDMVMGLRMNGIDAVALFKTKDTSGKKYKVEYLMVENSEYSEAFMKKEYEAGNFKTGLVAYNAPDKKLLIEDYSNPDSINNVIFGIPTWDLVEYDEGVRPEDGYTNDWHHVYLRISDENGNFKFLYKSFRSKILKDEFAPTYDFTSKEALNNSMTVPSELSNYYGYIRYPSEVSSKTVFYTFETNNWKYKNFGSFIYAMSYIKGDYIYSVIDKIKQKNSTNGTWIKYYTTISYCWQDGNHHSYHFEGTPSYWQYAYIPTYKTLPTEENPEPQTNKVPECSIEPSIIGSAGGAMISGDVPALVYTVASSYNRDKTDDNWDIRTKQISPKIIDLSSSKNLNIYSYDVSELPEGWYYKIFARFPDGTVISTPVQKNECN